jgi:hypothetical protein
MLTSSDLLFGVALPFALATLILLVAWRPWRHNGWLPGFWGGPLAVGASFDTTFAALQGPGHVIRASSAIMWLFYIAVVFTLLALVDARSQLPRVVRGILVFAVTGAGAALLLQFNFTNQTWDRVHGALWLGAIAAIAVLWWASFEQSAVGGGLTGPLAMAAVGGISALIIAVLVEQTTGQALGALAIALTVAVVLAAWSRRASVERGTAMVLAGIGVSALAGEYFISSLPFQYVLLIAFAPVTLWAGRIPAVRRMRPWLRVVIQLVLLCIPLGIAAALAIVQAQKDATLGSDPYTLNSKPAPRDAEPVRIILWSGPAYPALAGYIPGDVFCALAGCGIAGEPARG